MAEVDSYSPAALGPVVKDARQLKKEKKDQERLQKEREKQEKKLEKERKKQEELERKQREKEAKSKAKAAADTSASETKSAAAASLQSPPAESFAAAAETAATTNGDQRPVSGSAAEKVSIAESPGQISGCGTPIGIVFDATQAGEGPLTASCAGANVGTVPVSVTEPARGIYRVQFTPPVADVYTLSVMWGGKEVGGSPFTVNLSVLPPATPQQPPPTEKQAVKEAEKVEVNGQQKKEEEVVEEEVSDDPFEMALQASRLLEEQRKQATASFNSDSSSTPPPQTNPAHQSPRQHVTMQQTPLRPHVGRSSAPYPTPNQPLPYPEGFPATKEDVNYLEEMNKKLQETNEGLGQEVADLKKKMGEFETKLTTIEETSRMAEEERKELMANISLHGWLYKRGIKGPTANVWRHRYFRCDQGDKIYYYKAADDPSPKGSIDLEKVESVEAVESEMEGESGSEKFCFNIICPDRIFQLHTDTEDTRRQWITAIQYLKNWHQANKSILQSLANSQRD